MFIISRLSKSLMKKQIIVITNQWRYVCNQRERQTMSYWHEPGKSSFLYLTLGDLVNRAADSYGDNVAFVIPFQNIRKTFYQFKNDVDQLAMGLIGLGLNKNDRLALWSPSCYEWIVTQYAAHKAGLILVCINPAYRAAELEYSLQKMECKAIVAAESFKNQQYYDTLCEIIPEIPNSKAGNIQSQKLKNLRHIIKISDKSFLGTHSFKEVMKNDGSENRKHLDDRMSSIQTDDACSILFTSGTTGKPKGAALSHFQLINQGQFILKRLEFAKKNHKICVQVPLFHIFGLSGGPIFTLLSKATSVFPSGHFNAQSSLKTIQDERCTIVYGTPTMYIDMLTHLTKSTYDLSSWKEALVGATPIPGNLLKMLREKFGITIFTIYGATEVTGMFSAGDQNTPPSAVRILEHSEVKIINKNGYVVPINTIGEILCRSPHLFLGYWGEKEKTEEVIDWARWYHTGDTGFMNEDGSIVITGRIKDMIIRGGENIYPQEIEDFLLSHPNIKEVYVVGVPDSRLGEELCACVQLKHNQKFTEKDIREFCSEKISYFKIPRYMLLFENFPKTESGKIQKYLLRKECIEKLKLQSQ